MMPSVRFFDVPRLRVHPTTALLAAVIASQGAACADDGNNEDTAGSLSGSESGSGSGSGSESGAASGFFSKQEIATILGWLGPLPDAPPPDPTNAYADDDAAALLGQKLFFDPRYSGNGEISCVTCHDPQKGFGDSRGNVSEGISMTPRSSIGLLNGAYGAATNEDGTTWQLWDGRADSQWSQALGPPESPVVMGGTRSAVALLVYDEYRSEYEAIFGPLPELRNEKDDTPVVDPTLKPGVEAWDALPAELRDAVNQIYVNFGKALAAYERRLVSRNSRFDQYWKDLEDGNDSDVLSEEEKEGLRVYIGDGRCLGCHSGPNFTDGQFHNLAIAQTGANLPTEDQGRASGVQRLLADAFNCAGVWSDHPDKSACAVSSIDPEGAELGAFKTPTLRSVNLSPPYMHTGTLATLEEVIRHYDKGGDYDNFVGVRDELMRPLDLDARQRAALVAFLRTLDGEPLDASLLAPP